MKNDYPFLYSFIIGTSAVFIAIMLVFQRQQNKKLSVLREQVKQAHEVTATTQPPTSRSMIPHGQNGNEESNEPITTGQATDTSEVDEPNQHIEQDKKQIADLKLRLASLDQAATAVGDRVTTAQKQQKATVENQNVDLDRQIATVNQSIHEVDQKLQTLIGQANTNPPETVLQQLRTDRLNLQNQLEQLNLQKRQASASGQTNDAQASTAATAERDRIRNEQEDIRKQINQLQVDLENWQKKDADQKRVLQAQ